MSDISMCRDATCPLRHECYRFSARANPYGQSYADFKYRGQEQGEPLEAGCESFWRINLWDNGVKFNTKGVKK